MFIKKKKIVLTRNDTAAGRRLLYELRELYH